VVSDGSIGSFFARTDRKENAVASDNLFGTKLEIVGAGVNPSARKRLSTRLRAQQLPLHAPPVAASFAWTFSKPLKFDEEYDYRFNCTF
jgi:hypothetical protein